MSRLQPAVRRRVVIAVVSVVAALVLYAAAGFAGLPALGRSQLPGLLSQALGRDVTIGDIEFNPFTLRAVVTGLRVAERGSAIAPPVLTVARLELDGSWQSLTELAPVISGVRLLEPQLRLVRAKDGRYSIDDLIAKWSKPSDPNEPKPRFSVANIELRGGRIDFDDLPLPRSHRIAQIEIQVPFLSSLPVHQSVTVQPRLAMTVEGTRIDLTGRTRPFSATRESTLELSLAPIDLTPYVGYAPVPLPVKLMGAMLAGKAIIEFAQPPDGVPSVTIRADLGLTGLDLREPGGEPLLKLAELRLKAMVLQPLARRAELGAIEIDSPVLHVQRRGGQERFFQAVLDALPKSAPAAPAAPANGALQWAVNAIRLKDGRVAFLDGRFEPRPLAVTLDGVTLTTGRLSSDLAASLPFDIGFAADSGERVRAGGTLSAQPLRVEAKAEVRDITLNRWWWIAEPHLQADLTEGVLQLQTGLRVDQAGDQIQVRLDAFSAELKSLVLRQRWDKRDLLRLPAVSLAATEFDLAERSVSVGQLALDGGSLSVLRAPDGQTNLVRAFTASLPAGSDAPRAVSPAATTAAATTSVSPAAGDPPWRYTLKRITVERFAAAVRDAGASGLPATDAAAKAAAIDIADLKLQIDDFGNTRDSRGKLALRTRVGSGGSLDVRGAVGLNPVSARLRVEAKSIGVLPAQTYFAPYVNLVVGSGSLSTQGDLGVDLPDQGALRATYRGDVTLADFAAAAKGSGDDLLRWKSLFLGGVDFALAPLKVEVGQVALADFYTRLIIGPDGRFNLQDLAAGSSGTGGASAPASGSVAASGSASASASAATATATASATTAPSSSPKPAPAAPGQPAPAGSPLPVRIGRITLSNGNIDFTDLFVKPNYSANLTGMTGAISTLAPDTAGEVELRGRVDNAGSVEITGKLNPLAANLALDLTARARDIDLPRTSPYSVKYLGYGIEKGKLSATLKYKIEGRKLQSENSIVLDQLTFGEKVDSPTATKLPVLFAVALLKDRNGVIDVNLPIGGSLDDPEFSVGGLVLRIIFNLIVKAVTAPFTLLASLAGGGEELSVLEFGPGLARLAPATESRLKALAKALSDRPALRMDLAGRADPDKDGEALRKLAFERRLKAIKIREQGLVTAPGGLDAVKIDPAEYPKVLLAAYRAGEFPKPRTAAGALAEVPPAEMEKLLMASTALAPDELRELANARAQAAKEWLTTQGAIAGERLFVVAPRLGTEGVAAGASATRVDLSLK